jgi:hypothetical protein
MNVDGEHEIMVVQYSTLFPIYSLFTCIVTPQLRLELS